MNRCFVILMMGLALVSSRVSAGEIQFPTSTTVDGSSTRAGQVVGVPHPRGFGEISLFVGKYGETIEIPYYWTAFVESRGQAEAVYFHRKFRDDQSRVPFQPKPADFKLKDFSRLELMELVVIPKSVPGGLGSLEEMRLAKSAELTRNGFQFKIVEEKNRFAWPQGTFYVEIASPYRIFQTYSESPGEFYILTVGDGSAGDDGQGNVRASDYELATERASESLRKHLLSVQEKTVAGFWFKPESAPSEGLLANFKQFRLGATAAFLTASMMILAFWPGASNGARRARLFGRSLLSITSFAALAGYLSVYIPVQFGVIWRNSSAAELIPILSIPWVSWMTAMRFGNARPRRVLLWTLVLAAIFALDLIRGIRADGSIPAGEMAYEATLYLYVLGLASGVVSNLASGPALQNKVRA
ncbi:MAG: hypothetical protein Q8T11_02610 [Elusimicrobiota bacterium]|nr:hypothetical protein [Elusimicrobiota bacterium]